VRRLVVPQLAPSHFKTLRCEFPNALQTYFVGVACSCTRIGRGLLLERVVALLYSGGVVNLAGDPQRGLGGFTSDAARRSECEKRICLPAS
jgi:hypothetical protein